jgi:hypothetical protein
MKNASLAVSWTVFWTSGTEAEVSTLIFYELNGERVGHPPDGIPTCSAAD